MPVRKRRRWMIGTAALLAVAGVAAAGVLAWGGGFSAPRPAPPRSTPLVETGPLRSNPRIAEPVAGDPATESEEDGTAATGSPSDRGRGKETKPPSAAEIREQLQELKKYYASQRPKETKDLVNALLPSDAVVGLKGWHTSVASTYFDYGLPIACGDVLGRDQLGVAHRSLPCGTKVTFRYRGRAIRVPVVDRGPYIAGREWDLTGATAIALDFSGLDPIDWTLESR